MDIFVCVDGGELTVGEKRNILLEAADGEYTAFIDDDDKVHDGYIREVLRGIESGCDVVGFVGTMSGGSRFIHTLHAKSWCSVDAAYIRTPNHLNPMRSSIAKQFKFPHVDNGEDHAWSMAIAKSGLLKKEHLVVDKIMYFYNR